MSVTIGISFSLTYLTASSKFCVSRLTFFHPLFDNGNRNCRQLFSERLYLSPIFSSIFHSSSCFSFFCPFVPLLPVLTCIAENTVTKRKKSLKWYSMVLLLVLLYKKSRKSERLTAISLVPETGVEPVYPKGCQILSLVRLPFRHSGILSNVYPMSLKTSRQKKIPQILPVGRDHS